MFLYPGIPEGSTGSGSGLKASQKTGQRLKSSTGRSQGSNLRPLVYKTDVYPLHHGGFLDFVCCRVPWLYQNWSMGDITIDSKGVAKLLDGLNVHKAPGPDGLNARVLKECNNIISPILAIILMSL